MCSGHTARLADDAAKASASARIFMTAIRGYQDYLSPLKRGPSCRFEPSCSAYALDAVDQHGALKGIVLAMIRLAKCGPWHPGGFDPMP